MASSSPNPNQPPLPFSIHPLFHPPPTNPNPNPNFHPFSFFPFPPNSNPNPNAGASLMALLNNAPPPSPATATSDFPPAPAAAAAARVSSSKMPRGRPIGSGDRAVVDVDARLVVGQSPQLEVTPITKYSSDPGLVLGRQIAVNRTYICYGLKMGNVRVLNINTAIRVLFKGHSQRVTDMAFFAEDVHLLASASVDGKVYVWKIDEGPDEENKPQITGNIVVAIQIVGDGGSYHPRICWHSHKQEVLIVAVGNRVLKIDATKVGRGKKFSADKPLECPIDKLIDGVQLIGRHEGDVTDLSISQWMTTRLASASKDGTVKIWDDRKTVPLATIRPHQGHPVNSVAFLTSPHRPDHIILITAGPLNREVKLWTSTSEEGWLLPSDSEKWQCTQTLELRSSSEPRPEEAFFNQVVVFPHASLIVLANAKKNALYAVHVDYGSSPVSTRMDYIADFAVAMPILSLTGTSDSLPDGEQVVQIYCVQTQAIQQYALDLSRCLPPPAHVFDPPNSEGFVNAFPLGSGFPITSLPPSNSETSPAPVYSVPSVSSEVLGINVEVKPSTPRLSSADSATTHSMHSPATVNVDLSGGISVLRDLSKDFEQADHQAERRADTVVTSVPDVDSSGKDKFEAGLNENIFVRNHHLMFKLNGNPTHLVTPSEILSGAISSSGIVSQDQKSDGEVKVHYLVDNNDIKGIHVEAKHVIETRLVVHDPSTQKEPQVGSGYEASNQMRKVTTETYTIDETQGGDDTSMGGTLERPEKAPELVTAVSELCPTVQGKKQLAKESQAALRSSPSLIPFNSTDSLDEPITRLPSTDASFSQLLAMQDMLNQIMGMQKEMRKQMNSMIAGPVNKEGKRVETALARSMEKSVKANSDALWARFQEETAKREKVEREHMQQLTSLITTSINKDMPSIFERAMKKEISTIGPVLARTITPVTEKSISSAISDSFQRGVGDKAVGQLEKSVTSKFEGTVARQIQAQFQTSGKQALQDALRLSLEASVIPAFEQSCRTMFEQVDSVFQKGMNEHTASSQKQFDSAYTLATTLRDAINSASSLSRNLSSELADGQQKILAFITGNTKALNPMHMQPSYGLMGGMPEMQVLSVQQIEAPLDPTKELSRLISEHKFGEAFTMALQRCDVSIVSWLCSKVDLHAICTIMEPIPLNQGVLLALLQQLACDISNETARKLGWMTDVASAIIPTDPTITLHVRLIFEQVNGILTHQRSLPTTTASEASGIRLLMHVINSVLMSCK